MHYASKIEDTHISIEGYTHTYIQAHGLVEIMLIVVFRALKHMHSI